MSKLMLLLGPVLVRLLSKTVAKELLATVVNTIFDKVQAQIVSRLPAEYRSGADQVLDGLQAQLLSDSGLSELLNLVTAKVNAAPTVANR